MRGWLFRFLFRADYEHMRHLVDDVIKLEKENEILRNKPTVVMDANSSTIYFKAE